ncbi:MAG: peptide chain release factor N(5)-glutamine methyltransferase [Caldimonas sp.]
MTGPTVAHALAQARERGLDRLDASLLLGEVLHRSRTWLLAHGDAPLTSAESAAWDALAARRAGGEPLAYIIGRKEFRGLVFRVEPSVLIPRPETEILVEQALGLLRRGPLTASSPRLVDLGTGSGAIAIACKSAHPAAKILASDTSAAALAVARANAARLGVEVEFRIGSWWQPWAGERFDIIVSNPPYVAAADPHLVALRHEPLDALSAGIDGLEALEAIVGDAARHLQPGGWIWLEHGFDQAPAVRSMFVGAGFSTIETVTDLASQPRCTGATL